MSLPWVPEIHTAILRFFIDHTLFISLIGLLMLITGSVALSYIYFSSSRRSFYVKKGTHSISVDQKVLDGYITQYLKEIHPSEDIPHQLIIRKRRILISTDLPHYPKAEQEPLAEKIYDDIIQILEDKFGCKKDLYLSVSFQPAPKEEAV